MLQTMNVVAGNVDSIHSSESISINNTIREDDGRKAVKDVLAADARQKYLHDGNFIEEVKTTLRNYVKENCIMNLLVRIRDNESKGYAVRVQIQGDQSIGVSDFLNDKFCTDKRISRVALMTDKGQNGLSCDVNAKGVRCYKVQNGPPVVLTANWCVGEKRCSVVLELGINDLKIIKLNGGTDEELSANREIVIYGKSLIEAVKNALELANPESGVNI